MTHDVTCESCGMPIESGQYCAYCTDADGTLQTFDDRFERMVSWQAGQNPSTPREQVEAETLAYMATMPAWKDHPRVLGQA